MNGSLESILKCGVEAKAGLRAAPDYVDLPRFANEMAGTIESFARVQYKLILGGDKRMTPLRPVADVGRAGAVARVYDEIARAIKTGRDDHEGRSRAAAVRIARA
jgi:hypothetical protein